MSCNCNTTNSNTLRSTIGTAAVDTGGTYVLLTPDNALAPVNQQRLSLAVTTSIPTAGMSLPVYVVMNGANVPVYDKYGNIVYGTDIMTRAAMHGYYGVNGSGGTAHVQLVNFPYGRSCS